MERFPETQSFSRQLLLDHNLTKNHPALSKEEIEKGSIPQDSLELDPPSPAAQKWRGKNLLQEAEDLILPNAISFRVSIDSLDEAGSTSFHGVSHPAEPVDTDLMRPVNVPFGQNNGDGKHLVRHPFMEDLLIGAPNIKPIPLSSPAGSLAEEPKCIWDASLPPSGNASPHSSIDSVGFTSAMSIVNSSASTYRSDGMMSDGMKGSIRGDSIESTKTSLSRASDSSGLSDGSNWSNITGSANKPHKGNDPRWKAILSVRARDGMLGMSQFRLLKRLGCGDIGSVYLSKLSATRCFFAMKVMDKASLASRKKLARAHTEREILQLLDHPFLPTLYAHFETDRFSCLVMEYCPGGDLHTLRQRQPGNFFSEYAARFYAAEVLLALEYLHMLGVVYRDLKSENVLVREDGHIMLSDFDLSLRSAVSPTLITTSASGSDPSKQGAGFCAQPSCIEPLTACTQPSCFLPRIFSKKRSGKSQVDPGTPSGALPELVAEPTAARSMSFVGTHKHLAPEIIKGEVHGSAVDWWTFGVFLHELLYGKTPFKGSGNRAMLFNVVAQQLKFPDSPTTSYASRDLIRSLLVKEPQNRLGVKRGATEIKQHPFFEGVNWALIRCSMPAEVLRPVGDEAPLKHVLVNAVGAGTGGDGKLGIDMKSEGKYLDFEFF